jgi:molybdopterin-binding protein
MKISARNRLKGKIVEVKKGATTAHIRLDVNGTIVTASITNEAVDELGLKAGQDAYAIVKASDVMIGLDGGTGRDSADFKRAAARPGASKDCGFP